MSRAEEFGNLKSSSQVCRGSCAAFHPFFPMKSFVVSTACFAFHSRRYVDRAALAARWFGPKVNIMFQQYKVSPGPLFPQPARVSFEARHTRFKYLFYCATNHSFEPAASFRLTITRVQNCKRQLSLQPLSPTSENEEIDKKHAHGGLPSPGSSICCCQCPNKYRH